MTSLVIILIGSVVAFVLLRLLRTIIRYRAMKARLDFPSCSGKWPLLEVLLSPDGITNVHRRMAPAGAYLMYVQNVPVVRICSLG